MNESRGRKKINVRFEEPLKEEFTDNVWSGLAFINKDAVAFILEARHSFPTNTFVPDDDF